VRRRRRPARGAKYPADYNGVVVGGHAALRGFGQFWLWEAAHQTAAVLPAAKLPVIH
jgi:hypothetical protein